MSELNKLAGGSQLDCGHQQVISDYRHRLRESGRHQIKVFCIECDNWTEITPKPAATTED